MEEVRFYVLSATCASAITQTRKTLQWANQTKSLPISAQHNGCKRAKVASKGARSALEYGKVSDTVFHAPI